MNCLLRTHKLLEVLHLLFIRLNKPNSLSLALQVLHFRFQDLGAIH